MTIPEKHAKEASSFIKTLKKHQKVIERKQIQILQLNITSLCNQACLHCHMGSGPGRSENMSRKTMDRLLFLLKSSPSIQTVDITGGAPELNPDFRYLISEISKSGARIIERCNLTVLLESGQEGTARFLADHKVDIIASLPCYTRENVDAQRGTGAFDKSVKALKMLNELGYGKSDSDLKLDLVYNPGGAFLPGDQKVLESDYKKRLWEEHGIEFNNLLAIANMPINRFQSQLEMDESAAEYIKLLKDSFNPEAAEKVMCRKMISVDWEGRLSDCDFNLALDIPVSGERGSIWELESFEEAPTRISFGCHCHACAAGTGSS